MTEPEICCFRARDGVELAMAVYRPSGTSKVPALFAAAPYRFDNNTLPASPQFLWRETGPIDLYVEQGYAYCHLDLRSCGRSGGEFGMLSHDEQNDPVDAVEWIAEQPWSSGKVGSIGQSYYCMTQWHLAAAGPPALACVGAHDGLADLYRAAAYHGGVPCDFFPGYWWYQNRFINRFPANGPAREQETDLARLFAAHPLLDDFWRERSAFDKLDQIRVPLFSSGVWGKMQLHTRGNIDGFAKAKGEKKLRLSAAPSAWAAASEYASRAFHEQVMLPFYDHYLKGRDTSWSSRSAVEWEVRGAPGVMRDATSWPPAGVIYRNYHLNAQASGSVTSLNDGGLSTEPAVGAGETSYSYPDPGWVSGVVGFGPGGPAAGFDPARRVLTFTSDILDEDLEIAGPIRLTLYTASTATDTEFHIKLSDQKPQSAEDRAKGLNPSYDIVSRGWLRASHRGLDRELSSEHVPVPSHQREEPLTPGEPTRLDIAIEPQAYLFKRGHRIRLEIVNGDSVVTDALWTHFYRPDRRGRDTILHDAAHRSVLTLPVFRP